MYHPGDFVRSQNNPPRLGTVLDTEDIGDDAWPVVAWDHGTFTEQPEDLDLDYCPHAQND